MTFIEAHCPSCGRQFRENANRLCEGQVLLCPHCDQSWALSATSPFDEILRVLQEAREARRSRFERSPIALSTLPNRWYA